MDGYTVRAADLGDGGVPIAFRLGAGDRPRPLPPGSAAGIATGAPLPEGADAVVPIEVAREEGGRLVTDPPAVGAHIRERGGDVREGDLVGAPVPGSRRRSWRRSRPPASERSPWRDGHGWRCLPRAASSSGWGSR